MDEQECVQLVVSGVNTSSSNSRLLSIVFKCFSFAMVGFFLIRK